MPTPPSISPFKLIGCPAKAAVLMAIGITMMVTRNSALELGGKKLFSTVISYGFRRQPPLSMLQARDSSFSYLSPLQVHRTFSTMLAAVLDNQQIDSILHHIHSLNAGLEVVDKHVPFKVNGKTLGYCKPEFVTNYLSGYPEVFVVSPGQPVTLQTALDQSSRDRRSEAVGKVCSDLRQRGVITGWRNELLPVAASFYENPDLLIERAAYPFFSVKAYGVHVNGYVRNERGEISHLWVATRSPQKSTYPGMLDHIVAGALPFGIKIYDNVVKECEEEANIPESLARRAHAVGALSYTGLDEAGQVKRDAIFCFDLELPSKFTPKPVDGEVQGFELQPLEWVLDKVVQGGPKGFKPNCNLVLIDFFIRHGVISPETKGYLDIIRKIRGNECR